MEAYALTGTNEFSEFRRLPVLHEGRIKPLESFARVHLKQFSGKETINGKPAVAWLAESLFLPHAAANNPVFKTNDPNAAHWLGLRDQHSGILSYNDLQSLFLKNRDRLQTLMNKDPQDLQNHERKILEMHDHYLVYGGILKAFSALLPLQIEIPESIKRQKQFAFPEGPTYLELKKQESRIRNSLQKAIESKKDDLDAYTGDERKLMQILLTLRLLDATAEPFTAFRIIPPQWGEDAGIWTSPWQALKQGQGSPETSALLNAWQSAAKAYRSVDSSAWRLKTQEISQKTLRAEHIGKPSYVLDLEIWYRIVDPVFLAKIAYCLVLSAFALSLFLRFHIFHNLGLGFLLSGITLHAAAVTSRVVILDRAPVGSLYESALFVSLIILLGGGLIAVKTGKSLMPFIITAFGLGTLLIAPVIEPDRDNLENLVAVLNNNFWLSTHVIAITLGYGLCILCSALAHYALVQKAYFLEYSKSIQKTIHILALMCLAVVTLGTFLGGIWADQSWGRFWGWDPKENGALLIMLWLIWLLHARIGKNIGETGYLAGMAYLSVIVALSWFGVNLLSTGLHSYGFISGLAGGLAVFVVAETALIGFLWFKTQNNHSWRRNNVA